MLKEMALVVMCEISSVQQYYSCCMSVIYFEIVERCLCCHVVHNSPVFAIAFTKGL